MSAERDPRRLARAGIVGMAVIGIMVGLALNVQRLPLVGSGDTFRAEFADASGLVVGEEVRIAGIKVGTVTDLELRRGRVVAEFTVKGTKLGKDTTAAIEIKTILGQHYVSLEPDGPGQLPPGSTIPLSRTSSPLNVVPAFQQLTSDVEQIDTDRLAEAFSALESSVRAASPQLDEALRGLTRLSATVAGRDRQLRALFRDARTAVDAVADRDADLGRLLPASATVLTMLRERADTLNQIIDGVRDLATETTALVEDNQAQLGPVLEDLNGVLAVLQENKKQLDDTIRYARQYARVFVSVGGSGRWLETTVKTPNGYSLCRNEPSSPPALAALLDPLLSAINQASTGEDEPCLPLSPPAPGGAP